MKRSRALRMSLLCATIVTLAGCSTPRQTFYWGHYEDMVYGMYFEPGNADSVTQITTLQEDIETSAAKGLRIAPGIHAHLGYLYALDGNMALAIDEFETEKALFPESAVLIDGMLGRLQGAKQ